MYSINIEKFLHDGWIIVDVPDPQFLFEQASLLDKKAREITGIDCPLAEIHRHIDDAQFNILHIEIANFFWESEFSLRAGRLLLPLLKELIGLDIMVQYMPYLRLARPGRREDNIGYHKDTQYGQTPYELAVHIPFVDLDENAALKVISGSHRMHENAFEQRQGIETTVAKGSPEHMLGKPYAPKSLVLPEGLQAEPLTVRVGQAAFFSPALFHGQEINLGAVTRVSTDLRFVNANARVPLKTGKTRAGYVDIAHSPMTQTALDYYHAQQMSA